QAGDLLAEQRNWPAAEQSYREALKKDRGHVGALGGLGAVMLATARASDAAYMLSQAIAADPRQVNYRINLASSFLQMGRPDLARDQAEAAVHLARNRGECWYLLGESEAKLGNFPAAVTALTRHLELKPDFPPGLVNRAFVLFRLGYLDAAEDDLDRCLTLMPNLGPALLNKARLLHIKGDHAGAIHQFSACMEEATKRGGRPDPVAHSEMIVALDYLPGCDLATQAEERASWNHWHARPLARSHPPAVTVADPNRRLEIGVLSKDLFAHSAAFLYAPLFLNLDPEFFRIHVYDASEAEDGLTHLLRDRSESWLRVRGWLPEQIADRIRADRMDILVDLSGHLTPNLLLVHARKPAPLSVTGWGHATGTGMLGMDGFIADRALVPEESRRLFSETILDLPCALPYWPPQDAPDPAPPPSETKGFVTFGCFNRVNKINDAVLDAWAEILTRLPDSRLLLKDISLHQASLQNRLIDGFEARGIDLDRIEIEGKSDRAKHLAALARVDVILDPFPQAGGTSTWEALWQGVPVVTLAGSTPASRNGASILSALELTDLITERVDDYVEVALRLAADWQRRAVLRARLRERIRRSPAGDLDAYGQALGEAFRKLWRDWCTKRKRGETLTKRPANPAPRPS
ncbi:MAG: tetratricopeptide repeat protein, partial [Rhodospirillales bacterium]